MIQSALQTFVKAEYGVDPKGIVSGMSRILIHDACDMDIGIATPSQMRKPILAIPVTPEGIDAFEVTTLAHAAQDICNFGASRRKGGLDESYQGQPIDEAVAILTKRGLCASPHATSGKDGTFIAHSFDGFVSGDDLHLQVVFDT
jgi:hypothetical protein